MSLFPLLEESAIPDTLAPLCDLTIFMHVIINDKELCKKQKQKKNLKRTVILRESSLWKDLKTNPFNNI